MLDIAAVASLISAACIAVISSVFMNIRHSRCSHIKCCGCECKRDVMTLQEIQAEALGNNNNTTPNNIL